MLLLGGFTEPGIVERNNEYEFLMLFFDKQGNLLNEKNELQKIQNDKINSLNELKIYRDNIGNLEQSNEFYLLVSLGNSI